MSTLTSKDLLWRPGKVENPALVARLQHILELLLEASPRTQRRLIEQGIEKGLMEGRLAATRAALRSVLARRQLAPRVDQDVRIAECTDLATLERWLDRAITAVTASDVLR